MTDATLQSKLALLESFFSSSFTEIDSGVKGNRLFAMVAASGIPDVDITVLLTLVGEVKEMSLNIYWSVSGHQFLTIAGSLATAELESLGPGTALILNNQNNRCSFVRAGGRYFFKHILSSTDEPLMRIRGVQY